MRYRTVLLTFAWVVVAVLPHYGASAQDADPAGPFPVTAIPELSPGDSMTLDASAYFASIAGGDLTHLAETSDDEVVAVTTTGTTLTLIAVSGGTATITVRAVDAVGRSAQQALDVVVTDPEGASSFSFDLSSVSIGRMWDAIIEYIAPRWLPTLLILLAAFLVLNIVRRTAKWVDRRWFSQTENLVDDHVLCFVRRVLLLSTVIGTLVALVVVWDRQEFADGNWPRMARWLTAIWVAGIFFPVSRFVGDLLTVVEGQLVKRTDTVLDDTALPMVTRFLRFIIMGVGIVMGLSLLGINIAPLIAGAGVMGLALSLAAKDTLSNLIAGVLLILDRPFQVGDRIELWTAPSETGTWGDVIEIGLRATKIRNPDNLVVVVPNNEIMQRDIINYTMSGQDIRLRIPFSVAYESDVALAKNILIECAKEVRGVKTEPEPLVIVRGFGPSDVQLQLRVWVLDARARRRIADDITALALAAFSEQGVEIPYPKRELLVRHAEAAALLENPKT